jgi:hypothetical protein
VTDLNARLDTIRDEIGTELGLADLEALFGPSHVTVTKRRFGYEIQISHEGMEWLPPHWRPTRKSAERHARATAQAIRAGFDGNGSIVVARFDV